MKNKALVVIDLQNDITKNYQKIIGQVNKAIDWAVVNEKLDEMFAYYADKGCEVLTLEECKMEMEV